MKLCENVMPVEPTANSAVPVRWKPAAVRRAPCRTTPATVACPKLAALSVTPGAAGFAFRETFPYVPSARHTAAPGAAEDTADWAAETLLTVVVHPLVGGTGSCSPGFLR